MKKFSYSILERVVVFSLSAAFLTGGTFAQNAPEVAWSTNLYSTFPVRNVAFSSDGALLVSCVGRTIWIWRVSDKSPVRTLSLSAEPVAADISADRALVAAGIAGGRRSVWRISDGVRLWNQTGSDNHYINSVSFSPDSNALAWGASGFSEGIGIVESTNGAGLPFDDPERGVFDVRFSPDGTFLASANEDNTASLFHMPEGTLIRDLTGHGNRVNSVDVSSDGKLLATCASDGTARLWRVEDGTSLRTLNTGYAYGRAVRFSADGRTLLTSFVGTSGERALQFWRVSDGKLLLSYTNLNAGPIAVSRDGKYFAFGTGTTSGTNAAVVLARMPLLITNAAARTNAFNLEWQGGSGLYQVQQTTNLSNGVWEPVAGPTNATALNVGLTNRAGFFRVQSLPAE